MESQPTSDHRMHQKSGSTTAVLALLLVSLANQSVLGSIYLACFLFWGLGVVPSPDGWQRSKALWVTVSGVSTVALVAQLAAQLAYLAGPPLLSKWYILKGMEVLGFPRSDTALEFAQVSRRAVLCCACSNPYYPVPLIRIFQLFPAVYLAIHCNCNSSSLFKLHRRMCCLWCWP
jgi:hypothetical protein